MSFSIKLQERNLNVCEEYKTKHEVQKERSAKCENQIKSRVLGALFASEECDEDVPVKRVGSFMFYFYILIMDEKVLVLCEK